MKFILKKKIFTSLNFLTSWNQYHSASGGHPTLQCHTWSYYPASPKGEMPRRLEQFFFFFVWFFRKFHFKLWSCVTFCCNVGTRINYLAHQTLHKAMKWDFNSSVWFFTQSQGIQLLWWCVQQEILFICVYPKPRWLK